MDDFEEDYANPYNNQTVEDLARHLSLYRAATMMTAIWQPLIIIGGLIGNALIILVMLQKSNRWSSCSNYIAILAVSDSVALFRKAMDHAYAHFGVTYTKVSCGLWVYLALTACQYSMLLVMCMTVDRFIVVKFPKSAAQYCNPKRARMVMVVLLLPALVFNIPHYFLTHPLPGGGYCAAFTENNMWSFMYGLLQVVVNLFLPVLSLSTMTIMIIQTLRKNRKVIQRAGTDRRSSDVNFEIHIHADGLFYYVITYIVKGLRDLIKDWSTSTVNLTGLEHPETEQAGKDNPAFSTDLAEDKIEGEVDSHVRGQPVGQEKETGEMPNIINPEDADGHNEDGEVLPSAGEGHRELAGHTHVDTSEAPSLNPKPPAGVQCTHQVVEHSEMDDISIASTENPVGMQRSISREHTSYQLTVMLLLVVLFFVLLTIPQHVRYIIYNLGGVDRWRSPQDYAMYVFIYHFSNKAYFTNCAVNFLLYVCGSAMFRRSLRETLTCYYWRQSRQNRMADEEADLEEQERERQWEQEQEEVQTVTRHVPCQVQVPTTPRATQVASVGVSMCTNSTRNQQSSDIQTIRIVSSDQGRSSKPICRISSPLDTGQVTHL